MASKICEQCGQEFVAAYAVTAAYWSTRRFCSYTCAREGMRGERRSTFGKEKIPLKDRFWSKVDKNGPIPKHCPELDQCWVWTGARMLYGYGYLGNRRKPNNLAHRLSWEIHCGVIPESLCVLHKCDNPPCVNPSHLFLGTRIENNKDCVAKERNPDHHKESNPNVKLTQDDIEWIFLMRADGATQQEIADIVHVTQSHISSILRGKAWN